MNEVCKFIKAWEDRLEARKRTWCCKECGRCCPNCAGRSCVKCCVKRQETASGHLATNTDLSDKFMIGGAHKDALFGHRVVHSCRVPCYPDQPSWSTELNHPMKLDDLNPRPLARPPWPWEQARYQPNTQFPITYQSPAQIPEGWGEKVSPPPNYFVEVPPFSYHLAQCYKSTHPQYIVPF